MSRLASLLFAGAAVVSFTACVADGPSEEASALAGNLDLDGCVKIEGSAIGQAGVSVTLGTLSVTFESWIAKAGEPNEFVGFTLSTGATFYVKAGSNADDLLEGSGTSWVNPNGTGGPTVKGISNIQICEITPPPPPPPPEEPPPPPPPPEEPPPPPEPSDVPPPPQVSAPPPLVRINTPAPQIQTTPVIQPTPPITPVYRPAPP
ncbi:MAG: hypothetical protein M3680_09530, partial [Myxococcota bacterium]|nr:hypothetical protein [Myxococcota bacterium]